MMAYYLCSSFWPAIDSFQSATSRLSLGSLLNAVYGQPRVHVIYLNVVLSHVVCTRRNNEVHNPTCWYPFSLSLSLYIYIYIINQHMYINISYRFLKPRRSGLYCAMQTESLNTISIQAVSHRPFSAEARLLFPLVHVRYGGGKSGNWTGFSAKTSVFLCQFHYASLPHFIFIYMFLIPKGQMVEACQPLQSSFRSQEALDRKVFFTK
jgi:hypothetical protein